MPEPAPASSPAPEPASSAAPLRVLQVLSDTRRPLAPNVHLREWVALTDAGRQVVRLVYVQPGKDVRLRVTSPHPVTARLPVSQQAAGLERPGGAVVAAVNGDFFYNVPGLEGLPLGVVVAEGTLKTDPRGPAVGFTADGEVLIGVPAFRATAAILDDQDRPVAEFPLAGINRPRGADQLILYTPAWGGNTGTNPWGVEVALSGLPTPLPPAGTWTATVTAVFPTGTGNAPIEPGGVILSGHGQAEAFLAGIRVGDRLRLRFELPSPWDAVADAVGGSPILLRDGRVQPFDEEQAFGRRSAPRAAIGRDGDQVVLAVLDGRQPGYSEGLTLRHWAELLAILGLEEALNLDGGGSATLVVRDQETGKPIPANRPSDGKERPVASVVAVLGSAPPGSTRTGVPPLGVTTNRATA
ncbi:MAG: phosphodiester glycosidase family protein, partial [Clostridia bacterium]|nr:phosphodiester glycosidase family protein [Clostridia bacterium]